MDWILKEESERAYEVPCPIDEIPFPLWQVLFSRNLKEKDSIEDFTKCSLNDLKHPSSLYGMDKACDRLLKAYKEKEKIGIYADFDLDGTPGLALMKKGLEEMGFLKPFYYQPKRLSEGYGFHEHVVEDWAKKGVSLIITIDVGVTETKTCKKAKDLGVDVILTDHHIPKEELPEAFTIINPHQKDCTSSLEHLCGTGVAFYLIWALSLHMKENSLLSSKDFLKEIMDCFPIGTLSDVVALKGENRILTKHGLDLLKDTKRQGLKSLLKILDLDQRALTEKDICLKLNPHLNALSRMEKDLLPLDVFLEEDKDRAHEMALQVLEYNKMRKRYQKEAEILAHDQVKKEGLPDFVFVYNERFHHGVLGIVASRLVDAYKRPSFVAGEKKDSWVGSVRVPSFLNVDALKALEDCASYLIRFGGHRKAAGFELQKGKEKDFSSALKEHFKSQKLSFDEESFVYDAELSLKDLNPFFMKWYDDLRPFGPGFLEPLFFLPQLALNRIQLLKKTHYKFHFQSEGISQEALWFFPKEDHPIFDIPLKRGEVVDVLGSLDWNHYQGRKTLQIHIRDMKRAS